MGVVWYSHNLNEPLKMRVNRRNIQLVKANQQTEQTQKKCQPTLALPLLLELRLCSVRERGERERERERGIEREEDRETHTRADGGRGESWGDGGGHVARNVHTILIV